MSLPPPADLDSAIDAVSSAAIDGLPDALRDFLTLARRSYRSEEQWLAGLPVAIRHKLAAQHEDILEIGAALAQSLDRGHAGDVAYLVARLCALARHNLIEKQRDVEPHYPAS